MTVVSYHSTIISGIASSQEAAGTTSSQIFLSRGVAAPDPEPSSSPHPNTSTYVTSVFESDSRHIMTLGDAVDHTKSSDSDTQTDNEFAFRSQVSVQGTLA
jgi:hypothetical protein